MDPEDFWWGWGGFAYGTSYDNDDEWEEHEEDGPHLLDIHYPEYGDYDDE